MLEYSLEDHCLAEIKTVPESGRMVKPPIGLVHGHMLFSCADSLYRVQVNKVTDSGSCFALHSDHSPLIWEYPSQLV